MDAKTKKALDDLATARKIKNLMDDRFDAMLMEFVGNWPFCRPPLPNDFSKVVCKKLAHQWKTYLEGLEMKMVTERAMERAVRSRSHDIHVRDPAADWRDSVFGGTPAYIRISEEVAMEILALGTIP